MHLGGGGARGHSMTLTSLQSWPTHYESVLEEYVNLEHPQPLERALLFQSAYNFVLSNRHYLHRQIQG